jgi:CRISP-associated protein Cas1
MQNSVDGKKGVNKTMRRTRLSEVEPETIQEVLTLREQGLSHRRIATAVGLSHGSVMRIVKWQETGERPKASKATIPKRPRNGQGVLPDFERVSQFEANGLTVKRAWEDYVNSCSQPYTYAHFSTLYRVWLEEQTKRRDGDRVAGDPVPNAVAALDFADFSAEEDRLAELYWKRRTNPRSSIHVLSGFNCSLKVRNDELVASDTGEERSFSKVTHGLQTIAFLGEGGHITVDAIKWCEAQDVGICVLDWQGDLISVTTPQATPDVTTRRAQFAANRLAVAQGILERKLESQVAIGKFPADKLRATLPKIRGTRSVDELLLIEARAALEYWDNWCFILKHRKRNWPSRWTLFAYRASLISGGPRHATHPVNAILNYAYSVAAARVTRSLIASGYDSTAGFLHADASGRHSLTYDVLELLRADIDLRILPWVASHTWKRSDFPVTPEGIVRLQPPLAALVVQKVAVSQARMSQVIDWLGTLFRTPSRYTASSASTSERKAPLTGCSFAPDHTRP